jgi:excisionase family DNA binding protein
MLSRPLLTLHEVADLLKVKESTVRAWIHDKSLRAVKFGREWRVAHKDLEAFLEAHANRPADVGQSASDPEPERHVSANGKTNGHDKEVKAR